MAEVRQQDYKNDVLTRQGDGKISAFLDEGRKSTTAERVAEIRAEHPDLPGDNIYDLNSVVENGQWRDSDTEELFNFIPDEGYRYDRIGMAYDVNSKTYQYDDALPRIVRSGIAQGFGHLRDMASEPVATAMAGLYEDGKEGAVSDIERVWTPDYLLEARTNPADTWAAYGEEMGASLVAFGVDWVGGKSILRSKGQTAPKKIIDAIDPVRWKKFMSGFATRLEQETQPSLIFAEFINARDPLNDVNAAPMVGAWLESMGMTGQTVEYLKNAQDDQFSKGVTNVILGTMMMELMRGAGASGFKVGKFAYDNAAEFVQKAYKNAVNEMDSIQKALNTSMVAFHGTGAKFDKFSTEFMGSGEGAQAYGYGAYFAESKGVGGRYQLMGQDEGRIASNLLAKIGDVKAPMPVAIDAANALKQSNGNLSSAIKYLDERSSEFLADGETQYAEWYSTMSDAIKRYSDGGGENIKIDKGYLYEVDIPDKQIDKMLDWDAPLSEQSAEIQDAIRPLFSDEMKQSTPELKKLVGDDTLNLLSGGNADYIGQMKGSEIYQKLANMMDVGDDFNTRFAKRGTGEYDKAASLELEKLGIPGIKYLDGTSRSAGKGTRNFVVFKPDDLKILKRNEKKVK